MNLARAARESEASSGRIVTLAFLSKHLPATFLGEQLAQSLHTETGAPVVLLRLEQLANPGIVPGNRLADLVCDGNLRLPETFPQTEAGFHLLKLSVNGELHPPEWITALVAQLHSRFPYVLIEAVADNLLSPTLFAFLLQSNLSYLFVRAATEDIYCLDLLMRELRPHFDTYSGEIKPVLCLAEGGSVAGYDQLILNVAEAPVDLLVRDCPKPLCPESTLVPFSPTRTFRADLRRLARDIGDCLVGLALSSGGAKGLAHIGVIQVLEENGIEVDVVAGSSMGAYVGAIWSCGFAGAQLEALARELEPRRAMWSIIDPVFPPRQGFLRGLAVKKRLMRSIGNIQFAELPRPLRVVATNLETLERVVFSSGEVATAVHASAAVPGICVPITIDGETYIDGGIVDPLPVDVLREMGVARIIAVNAIPTSDRIRYCLQAERELERLTEKRARKLVRKLIPVDEHLNYFARGNILEILMRSIHGAQIRMAESLSRRADVILSPAICEDRWFDFRHPDKFILPGRKIAEQHLAEIKALVQRKAVGYERPTIIEPVVAVA
jgi:NTE family protein